MFANNHATPSTPPIMSQINLDVRISGTITVTEPLSMAGQIDGNIEAEILHITSTAVVIGDITAKNVVVDGKVTGNIVAEKVHLTAQAQVKGQIQCQGIMIDNGAYIDAKFSKEAGTHG